MNSNGFPDEIHFKALHRLFTIRQISIIFFYKIIAYNSNFF